MKKTIIVGILLFVVVITGLVFAQDHGKMKARPNKGRHQLMGELREEQQAEFKEIRMKLAKEIQPLQLQIEKMNVELKELLIAEKTNLRGIETKIDAISDVKAEIQKKRIRSKLAMRELLDNDQKIMFDRFLLENTADGPHRRGPRGGRRGQGRMGGKPFHAMPDDDDMEPIE